MIFTTIIVLVTGHLPSIAMVPLGRVATPPKAHLGPYNELATLSSVYLPAPICSWDKFQHCDVRRNIKIIH